MRTTICRITGALSLFIALVAGLLAIWCNNTNIEGNLGGTCAIFAVIGVILLLMGLESEY